MPLSTRCSKMANNLLVQLEQKERDNLLFILHTIYLLGIFKSCWKVLRVYMKTRNYQAQMIVCGTLPCTSIQWGHAEVNRRYLAPRALYCKRLNVRTESHGCTLSFSCLFQILIFQTLNTFPPLLILSAPSCRPS